MLNDVISVYKKELRSYFNSPIAYIILVFFLIFTSAWFFFVQRFAAQNVASLRGYFAIMPILFIFLLPALTMRSWAEEWKMKTDEILLTLPLKVSDLVLGKFLSVLTLIGILIVLSLPVPLSVSPLGEFDASQIFGEYFGMLLLAAAGISSGLFVSALSKNQISALLFGILVLLFITLIGEITRFMNFPYWIVRTIKFISLDSHFQSFSKGLIDSRDLAYFVLYTALFLYLNMKILIFRKWS